VIRLANANRRSALAPAIACGIILFACGTSPASAQTNLAKRAVLMGDFDGNGQADLLTLSSDVSGARLEIFLEFSWGNGTWASPHPVLVWLVPPDVVSLQAVTGDINGDRKDDLMLIGQIGSSTSKEARVQSFFSNGAGFVQGPSALIRLTAALVDVSIHCRDLNGDGKQDLIFIRSSRARSGTDFQAWLSDGLGGWSTTNPLSSVTPMGKLTHAIAALRVASQIDRANGRASARGPFDPRLELAERFLKVFEKLTSVESITKNAFGFLRHFEKYHGQGIVGESGQGGSTSERTGKMTEKEMKEREELRKRMGSRFAWVSALYRIYSAYKWGKRIDRNKDDVVNHVSEQRSRSGPYPLMSERERAAQHARQAENGAQKARDREDNAERNYFKAIEAEQNAKTPEERQAAAKATEAARAAWEKARAEREEAEKKAAEAKAAAEAKKKEDEEKKGKKAGMPIDPPVSDLGLEKLPYADRYGVIDFLAIGLVAIRGGDVFVIDGSVLVSPVGDRNKSNPNPEGTDPVEGPLTAEEMLEIMARILARFPGDPPDENVRTEESSSVEELTRQVWEAVSNPNPDQPSNSGGSEGTPPAPNPLK